MAKTANQVPGTVVKDFLAEYQVSAAKFAEIIKLSQSSIRLLVNNKLKISIPIALRLAKAFGNEPSFWVNLQNDYELAECARDAELQGVLKDIQKLKKPDPAKAAAAEVKKPPKEKGPRAPKAAVKKEAPKRGAPKKAPARARAPKGK
ncbi:MAG: HigA family addiction module antidote protein [Treponema sp.]|jgi:addiction module HigA family antidote|nr:HigA family addiction module antidote protein [Treponema sp.]